jgi:hypothetical protein
MGRREKLLCWQLTQYKYSAKAINKEGLLLMILFMKSVRSYLLEREYLSDERAFVFTVLRNDPSASLTGLGHQIPLCEYN